MTKPGPVAYVVSMGSGLETFIYRELEELTRKGNLVHLFATKYRPGDVFGPKKEWPYSTLTKSQVLANAHTFAFGAAAHPGLVREALASGTLVDLLFALRYSPIMKRIGARQVHCHFGDRKLFIGYYCKRLTGLPLSVTIHAHELFTNPNPEFFRKAILACDRVFPIAERWRRRLRDEFGVPEERMRLNRLFVDVAQYRPSAAVKVLAVGRFTERKGFHLLLDAAAVLTDLDVRFAFVGFGPLDLRAMARDRGVADRVTVFDKMDQAQLRFLYQTSDLFCLPSITTEEEGAEGIPVVLMEAMGCGLPVVATRCGATDEIVEEILVDENSVEQLADGIRRLASDSALRAAQGARNRAIVTAQYSVANLGRFEHELLSMVRVA